MKYTFPTIITFCFITACIFLSNSCAVMVPPSGGPRDSLAPVLVHATPNDSSTHFKGNRITIYFDEYVTIENVQQNVIVSPIPKIAPTIEGKLHTVSIKLRDSLEANTTYSINFGNSIKDVNEGNVAKELNYVFSTGDHLDSGYFAGKVVLAESGKIDSTLIVVLHQNLNDTSVIKNSPRYYAKLNGTGRFHFQHLPYGAYAVYTLPNDYGKKYDDSTKLFAFLNSPIIINEKIIDTVSLYAYQEEKEQPKKSKTATTPKKKTDKEIAEEKKLKLTSQAGGAQDLLSGIELSFSHKLKSFDSSKFLLTDTSYNVVGKPALTLDTSLTRITLTYKWPEYTPLALIIDSTAAVDSNGTNLAKNDTLRFTTKKESEYGSLRLEFARVDTSLHHVLQIFQNDRLYKSIPITQRAWQAKLFPPGEYELRILNDQNSNEIWDPGNFKEKRQPEIVIFLPQKLKVRGNWDNEANVIN